MNATGGPGDRDRRSHQLVERIQLILRRLDQDVVAYAVLPVEPEVGGYLAAAAQRNQQAAGDIVLREAELPGLDAIHIDAQLGCVHYLMHVNVGGAGNARDAFGQMLGDFVIRRPRRGR